MSHRLYVTPGIILFFQPSTWVGGRACHTFFGNCPGNHPSVFRDKWTAGRRNSTRYVDLHPFQRRPFFFRLRRFFSCLRKYPHILGCPQNYHYMSHLELFIFQYVTNILRRPLYYVITFYVIKTEGYRSPFPKRKTALESCDYSADAQICI